LSNQKTNKVEAYKSDLQNNLSLDEL